MANTVILRELAERMLAVHARDGDISNVVAYHTHNSVDLVKDYLRLTNPRRLAGWVIKHGERFAAATGFKAPADFEWTDELVAAIRFADRASAEQLAAILGDDTTTIAECELVLSPTIYDPDFPPT